MKIKISQLRLEEKMTEKRTMSPWIFSDTSQNVSKQHQSYQIEALRDGGEPADSHVSKGGQGTGNMKESLQSRGKHMLLFPRQPLKHGERKGIPQKKTSHA